ncbi:unnamed protein product [Symbiodinium natans]|uniref:Uncharacterized protein n=1 Tax=Symbiodinium natans TaxID=878477 RepID=A0A812HNQ9_9DINO|nr:unnamed protein product [Symbiodinium natans]
MNIEAAKFAEELWTAHELTSGVMKATHDEIPMELSSWKGCHPVRFFKGREIFGLPAFAEALCRLIFGRLLIYGNSLQQLLAPHAKVIWLLNYVCGVLQYDRSATVDPQRNPRAEWRGTCWQKLLEAVQGEEEFTCTVPPELQDFSKSIELTDDGTASRSRGSGAYRGLKRGVTAVSMVSREAPSTPDVETDEEAEAAATSDVGATPKVKLPPVFEDASGTERWLLARLLRSSVDLSYNYKKREKKASKRGSKI